MMVSMKRLALAFVLLALPAWGGEYRMGDYRAPVPLELEGATTLDTDEARALLAGENVVLLDVLPAPRRDDGLWLIPKPRLSLPGAVWLANTGYGDLSPAMRAWFAGQLEQLSGGDRTRPLMFFCVIDCWMSWNAARRALSLGYRRVYWYPDGADGWEFAGLPLERVEPRGP
jgi:PQQ-dependent catabolism-associated CXXCW motif protein